MAWLHSLSLRAEEGQAALQQHCHIQISPAETKCFGISKWNLLVHKAPSSSRLSKFKPAQKHNLRDQNHLLSALEQPRADAQTYHSWLCPSVLSLHLSTIIYSFSVGWPYGACYCSTSDVLVSWLHQDPTNSIPAFPASQCHPALAQSLDIIPPHPDSQQFFTVSYWNQEPICILLLSSQQGSFLSLTSFLEYILRKPRGFAGRQTQSRGKQRTNEHQDSIYCKLPRYAQTAPTWAQLSTCTFLPPQQRKRTA